MTDRIDALRALEKAVEAGTLPDEDWRLMHDIWSPRNWHDIGHNVRYAFHGSLDAAKALHEAVLPEWRMDALWQGGVLCGNDDDWSCRLRCVSGKSRVVENDERAAIPSPARACLCCGSRTLIAQEAGDDNA